MRDSFADYLYRKNAVNYNPIRHLPLRSLRRIRAVRKIVLAPIEVGGISPFILATHPTLLCTMIFKYEVDCDTSNIVQMTLDDYNGVLM